MTQCQGPGAQMVRLCCGLHLYLAERCGENLQSIAQCKFCPAIICSVGVTNIAPCFNNNSLTPRQFLRDKILLKKNQLGKMLIEQIIEFQLKKPGPPGRMCALQLVIFMTKQKFQRKIFEWTIIYS